MEGDNQQEQKQFNYALRARGNRLDELEREFEAMRPLFLNAMKKISLIKLIKLRDDVELPVRAYATDAGADLSIVREDQRISDTVWRYGTGLKVADIPAGYYLEIHARSSLPKYGLCLANGVGIIDEGYRGEILVQLHKIDPNAAWPTLPFSAVQLIVKKRVRALFQEVKEGEATATDRGEGGFGSTRADQGI